MKIDEIIREMTTTIEQSSATREEKKEMLSGLALLVLALMKRDQTNE